MTVTVSLSYTSLVVHFGDTTHTRILLDRLIGYQSWREGYGNNKFVIEYTVAGSAPILCEYDCEMKWKAILAGLDAVFEKPNTSTVSSTESK